MLDSPTTTAPSVSPRAPNKTSAGANKPVAPIAPVAPVPSKVMLPEDPVIKDAQRRAQALAQAKKVETQNRQREAKLKADRANFEAEKLKLGEAAKKASEYDRLASLAKEDPLKLLEAAGITTTQILERIVKGDNRTPEEIAQSIAEKTINERLSKDKAEAEKREKERAELAAKEQEKANQVTVQNAKKTISKLITDNPDKYEFCANDKASADRAWNLVVDYYTLTTEQGRPEILPYEEALDEIESDLENQFLHFSESSKKLATRKAKEIAEAQGKQAESGKARNMFRDRIKEPMPTPTSSPVASSNPYKARSRRAIASEFQAMIDLKKE